MSPAIHPSNALRYWRRYVLPLAIPFFLLLSAAAAPRDRITRPVNLRQWRSVPGTLHRLAQPQFDQGAVAAAMPMDYMVLLTRQSPEQQAELDQLLADQQNPASPNYRHWLTPEEFGARFGLSDSDAGKVTAWLKSEGFTVNRVARGHHWFAFSGTAAQVQKSFRTSIRRFRVDGEMHYANTVDPSVPEALADVVGGFIGLNDFNLRSFSRAEPLYNSGSSHYLAPEDFAKIYNVAPLYDAGIDGTGQSIAIVGQSNILLSDIRTFRSRHGLPANDPKLVPYTGTEPGFSSGAQVEANLDLEWAGAVAPKATIYYVYGPSAITAIVAAIDLNVAPIISISYGGCETDVGVSVYRAIAQQGNAQGITLLAAAGDTGAAGCDLNILHPFASQGRRASFPAILPEVTAVGGTQFVEGSGTYWASSNSPNFGSALSYIPEAAWNETGTSGLASTGGGVSFSIPKPAWQTGPGVPGDGLRDVPDVSLTAALHDAYYVTYQGGGIAVAGTSASAPAMAGIVALVNHYQMTKGAQTKPGLGNINPQLYRLAQSMPSAFHDTTAGQNKVPCLQGSPDCLTATIGFDAAPGYDMATGLGSVDANNLVTAWNTKTNGVNVTLFIDPTRATINDTIGATAIVVPASGDGVPTGAVEFSAKGLPLGSLPLFVRNGQQVADIFFPVYLLGTGTWTLTAAYSGDAAFSGAGATRTIQITAGTGAAAIILSAPTNVWASPPDEQGLSWQTNLTVREVAGVPAMITSFAIDGKLQPLEQYFPSPNVTASSTLSTTVVLRNLVTPARRTFSITGVDAGGRTWSRDVSVQYQGVPSILDFQLTATPSIVTQDTSGDPSCQWAVQLNIDELGGYLNVLNRLVVGGVDMTSQLAAIFGTGRVDAYNSVQGKLCFGGITPPASTLITAYLLSGGTYQTAHDVTVTFTAPPSNPTRIAASPAVVNLAAERADQPAQSTLSVDIADKTQQWTASVFPANRTTAWLSVSRLSGTGPAQLTVTANGAGFGPGAYRAMLVLQSPDAIPQSVIVPVVFVLGGSASGTLITGIGNAASYQATASPGMLLSVFGKNLADSTAQASGSPLPYSLGGVTATVNGIGAPLLYVTPSQLNIQIPYSTGAGPAVLGINNNGQIAAFQFQIAPSAPGVFADASGNLIPSATAKAGTYATLFLTGGGEVTSLLKTAYYAPSPVTSSPYRPQLPLTVTVGGVPAFVQLAALAPNTAGTVQVNFLVPDSVAAGEQPVVVTINGVSSPPVKLTVQ